MEYGKNEKLIRIRFSGVMIESIRLIFMNYSTFIPNRWEEIIHLDRDPYVLDN